MSIKDFILLEELGKGSFGFVYKVKRISDDKIYALKKVNVTKLNSKEKENSINEIRILASLNNQNVISYKDGFFDEQSNSICIVMEYAEEGDLEKRINNHIKNKTYFDENEIWNIFYQIVSGIKALHDKQILHRDLKCANIFIFKNNVYKIGDLNVSKVMKEGLLYTQTGTPYYASPEIWKERPYDYKSDIWSLGCVMYEICSLKPPFRGNSMEQVYNKVIKGIYESIPGHYSKMLSLSIASLLQVNEISRPSCDQILSSISQKRKLKIEKNQYLKLDNGRLLQTIRLPKNLKEINKILPKNKYKYINENIDKEEERLLKNNIYEHERNICNTEGDIETSKKSQRKFKLEEYNAKYLKHREEVEKLINKNKSLIEKNIKNYDINNIKSIVNYKSSYLENLLPSIETSNLTENNTPSNLLSQNKSRISYDMGLLKNDKSKYSISKEKNESSNSRGISFENKKDKIEDLQKKLLLPRLNSRNNLENKLFINKYNKSREENHDVVKDLSRNITNIYHNYRSNSYNEAANKQNNKSINKSTQESKKIINKSSESDKSRKKNDNIIEKTKKVFRIPYPKQNRIYVDINKYQ